MSHQIKPVDGRSLWNKSELKLQEIKVEGDGFESQKWVEWNGRVWLRKEKGGFTLSEVAGYQLAAFLKLPVQPWCALYDDRNENKKPNERVAMLVERWEFYQREVD